MAPIGQREIREERSSPKINHPQHAASTLKRFCDLGLAGDNKPSDLTHSHAKLQYAAANVRLFSLLILTEKI
jgi:hypothetical protein